MEANTYKLVLVGDGGVGKTTFVNKILKGNFDRRYLSTIGVEVTSVSYKMENSENVTLDIWDTAGQQKFGGIRDPYYVQAKAVIIMVGADLEASIKNIGYWANNILRVVDKNTPAIVVVNRIDQVSKSKLQKIKEKFNNLCENVCYISTLQDNNLNEIIENILVLLTGNKPLSISGNITTNNLSNIPMSAKEVNVEI